MRQTCQFIIEVDYNPNVTKPKALASHIDKLIKKHITTAEWSNNPNNPSISKLLITASSLNDEFRVVYVIDVDAKTPVDAAKQTHELIQDQSDPVFEVYGPDGTHTTVDLAEVDNDDDECPSCELESKLYSEWENAVGESNENRTFEDWLEAQADDNNSKYQTEARQLITGRL